MSDTPQDNKASIISSVSTPLGFLVLGLLVVDGTIAFLATTLSEYRTPLVWTIILSIPAFVATVVVLAVRRPEALRGDRPWQEMYAENLATDLYLSLDGALRNLDDADRTEAWLTVADVITAADDKHKEYTKFCTAIAARLKVLAGLSERSVETRGPVDSRA